MEENEKTFYPQQSNKHIYRTVGRKTGIGEKWPDIDVNVKKLPFYNSV